MTTIMRLSLVCFSLLVHCLCESNNRENFTNSIQEADIVIVAKFEGYLKETNKIRATVVQVWGMKSSDLLPGHTKTIHCKLDWCNTLQKGKNYFFSLDESGEMMANPVHHLFDENARDFEREVYEIVCNGTSCTTHLLAPEHHHSKEYHTLHYHEKRRMKIWCPVADDHQQIEWQTGSDDDWESFGCSNAGMVGKHQSLKTCGHLNKQHTNRQYQCKSNGIVHSRFKIVIKPLSEGWKCSKCKNGGLCIEGGHCQCSIGWTGENCTSVHIQNSTADDGLPGVTRWMEICILFGGLTLIALAIMMSFWRESDDDHEDNIVTELSEVSAHTQNFIYSTKCVLKNELNMNNNNIYHV